MLAERVDGHGILAMRQKAMALRRGCSANPQEPQW
jgi:hypothetical protein